MTTIDYAMRVATHLQSENKLEQAQSILKSILEVSHNHAHALHLSGVIAYQTDKIALGIELIQQAITSDASVALFHINLSEMYRQMKNIQLSIQHGECAIALDPNSANALSNLGIAYYDAQQYEKAEKYHQRALAINPNQACSLNNMGSIYKAYGKMQQAIRFYQAALVASPNFIEPLQNLAKIYYEQDQQVIALQYLDRALLINPNQVNLSIMKGSILMEMGEIQQSEEQFLKIAKNPSIDTQILAHYSLAQLRKINVDHPSLNALLSIEKNIHSVTPDKLPYFYFALGKCHHDMSEWAKAFAYFTQGCRIKRQQVAYNIDEQIQFADNIINQFTKEDIDYLRKFSNPSAVPIFIVGMPRSGTTLVEQILSSHPDVYGAGELTYLTELIPNGYPENIRQFSPEILRNITEKYLSYLRHISADAMRITDKMPNNFIAIGLIYALFPNAKIIHVKRNPIDTCLSCYTKLFSDGQFFSYDLTELGQYYNCYERIMNHWHHILPKDAFLEINYEDVIDNFEAEAKRLIAYCNLNWDPACLAFHETKRQVRTASFMQVRKPIYNSSVNGWRRYEKELAPLIKILSN